MNRYKFMNTRKRLRTKTKAELKRQVKDKEKGRKDKAMRDADIYSMDDLI